MGASTGSFGAVWAQSELRKVLAASGARVIDLDLPLGRAHEAFDGDGALVPAELDTRLGEILDALAAEAAADREFAFAA